MDLLRVEDYATQVWVPDPVDAASRDDSARRPLHEFPPLSACLEPPLQALKLVGGVGVDRAGLVPLGRVVCELEDFRCKLHILSTDAQAFCLRVSEFFPHVLEAFSQLGRRYRHSISLLDMAQQVAGSRSALCKWEKARPGPAHRSMGDPKVAW